MKSDQLVVGQCYFLLGYYDEDLRFPSISSYVFVGKNIFPDDKSGQGDRWYFQEPTSYLTHGAFRPQGPAPADDILAVDYDALDGIRDWAGLIDELAKNKRSQEAGETFD